MSWLHRLTTVAALVKPQTTRVFCVLTNDIKRHIVHCDTVGNDMMQAVTKTKKKPPVGVEKQTKRVSLNRESKTRESVFE